MRIIPIESTTLIGKRVLEVSKFDKQQFSMLTNCKIYELWQDRRHTFIGCVIAIVDEADYLMFNLKLSEFFINYEKVGCTVEYFPGTTELGLRFLKDTAISFSLKEIKGT